MANLPSVNIDSVWREVMRHYSALRQEVPFTKDDLRNVLVEIDNEMNSAETAVFQSITNAEMITSPSRASWLFRSWKSDRRHSNG